MISFGSWSLIGSYHSAMIWQHQQSNMLSVTTSVLREHPSICDRQFTDRQKAFEEAKKVARLHKRHRKS